MRYVRLWSMKANSEFSLRKALSLSSANIRSPYDGHYWALRKDKDGRWHKFDDHKVTEICAESIPTEHCRGCLVFLRKPE